MPGAVGQVASLGDDAVERGAYAVEPSLGFDELACCRREANAFGTAKILGSKEIELSPPLAQRQIDERLALAVKQEIKSDDERRRLARELVHAALRGMNALEQCVERECALDRHHDFAVEHEFFRLDPTDVFDQLGKIAGQRLPGF